MKLLIYADPHWSTYSSIVRSRGEKYSTRLENLIKTMSWIEVEAVTKGCDAIVCLGDFFDKSELNSEEVTALQEVPWSEIPHWFIVGNHEMGRGNLEHSSSHLFSLLPTASVIDEVKFFNTNDTTIVSIPYVLESNRKPLKEYLGNYPLKENVIILSHNDIAGIQMGQFISTTGFSVDEIKDNCKLFINGHLHNGTDIGNIINLGNITGQNFSEDAHRYSHNALILDTEEKSVQKIVNPYAMNFYKLDLTNLTKENDSTTILLNLNGVKYPAVVTVKATHENVNYVKGIIEESKSIIESRCIIEGSVSTQTDDFTNGEHTVDHIMKFQQFVLEHIGTSDLIQNELERVSK
jgi:DNA repair exonuclease SbcCD nuclease subunit